MANDELMKPEEVAGKLLAAIMSQAETDEPEEEEEQETDDTESSAQGLWKIYQALKAAGFSEAQAFELLKISISGYYE